MVRAVHIIAEGDSWFNLPQIPIGLSDVLSEFDKIAKKGNQYYIMAGGSKSFARRGDALSQMIEDISEIRTELRKRKKIRGQAIKAMLFSGGGNDLKDRFPGILKRFSQSNNGKDPFHQEPMNDLMIELETNYKKFIKMCKDYEVKMIAHTYCYPSPSKGGFRLFGNTIEGPWFEPAFINKGYHSNVNRKKICNKLIDDYFSPMLERLEEENKKVFFVIKTHEILKNKPSLYYDEIHLTQEGANIVAKAFKKKLDELFP